MKAAPVQARDGSPEGYRLIWNDEFDFDGLPDPTRWTYDVARNRDGWYNNELQYYSVGRRENARVEGGRLVIEARRERPDVATSPDSGGQEFTSARLVSRGLAQWTYGFFEVRAKVPCGRGTWPAAWLLPVADVTWPGGGEIDILEHVGHNPGVVHGTVHTTSYNHTRGTERGGSKRVAVFRSKSADIPAFWTLLSQYVVDVVQVVDWHERSSAQYSRVVSGRRQFLL